MEIVLTLKVVTPLFLAGAGQNAELRPASIRGALRYWLRAGIGGVIGDKNLQKLRELETDVFGDTAKGSPVVVRISQTDLLFRSHHLLPHKSTASSSTLDVKSSPFCLTLSLPRSNDVRLLETALWSTLLWLTLGGLGRRSRRGAGSLRLVHDGGDAQQTPWQSLPLSEPLKSCLDTAHSKAADVNDLAMRVRELVKQSHTAFLSFANPEITAVLDGVPDYPLLTPNTRIVIWAPPPHKNGGVQGIPAALMDKMSGQKREMGELAFSAAFGGVNPRRASPLHATTHEIEGGQVLVLTHLVANIDEGKAGKPEKVGEFLDSLEPQPIAVLPHDASCDAAESVGMAT